MRFVRPTPLGAPTSNFVDLVKPGLKMQKRRRSGQNDIRSAVPTKLGPDGTLDLPNTYGTVTYIPKFLNRKEADALFECTLNASAWECTPITFFGKTVLQPRDTAFYGTAPYSYSDETRPPVHWSAEPPASTALFELKLQIERALDLPPGYFNVALCNKYLDGKKYMGYHADDERSLGECPIIASISVGAMRRFLLRPKENAFLEDSARTEYVLAHGSLIVMAGLTQRYYKHSLPKQASVSEPRLNFTFRHVVAKDDEYEAIARKWIPPRSEPPKQTNPE
jgi:alkylated DNA repair dioxygenase AlkB